MIDRIDDDPEVESNEEADEPDLNWFECPMLPRGEMLAVIERHKDLDGRAVNLFKNALERAPRSDLFRRYVGPNLYHPGTYYIYTTLDPSRSRFKNWKEALIAEITALKVMLWAQFRRPEVTAMAIKHRSVAPCGVFPNPMAGIDAADLPPGQRSYNAGFAVYTI
jgi:hypothetical protein